MQAERWKTCVDLFHAAIERPPNERAEFLRANCNGDESLRREVELLLQYHEKSGEFILTPAFEVTPEFLVDDAEDLIGQQLGHYRIDAVLGVGGMGVVYLACDEKLGRKVGLKLLPQSLVGDETQLERLKREARTASALNHPNIVTIHEIGQVEAIHYIATEFIEGITLRERIAKGAVPPDEALDIATQVASALCVAHEAGIVHRDIKPENIMLRRDGYVKVLDFGIAKFTRPETSLANVPPVLQGTTHPGMILGTTRYMSPEQARGQAVDGRTDIWSLGVVLYEMLAGGPPFEGETPTDVLAAVLTKEPLSLAQRGLDVPAQFQRILEKTLQKDKEARYANAGELLDDLRQVKQEFEMDGRRAALGHSVSMNPRSFFAELRRRNVYRVAITYGVIAWLLVQAASILLPTFEAPTWVMKVFIVFLAFGFVISVMISWAFEVTPEGLKRTKRVSPDGVLPAWSARKFTTFIVGVAVVAIGLLAYQFLRPKSTVAPRPVPEQTRAHEQNAVAPDLIPQKSIAVLPFENRSKDEENAFFADAVQDQILTDLAKVADLKVISRTSVMQYKQGATRNLREIAQQLGVAHVLEGSVQRATNRVRVNAQLIDARNDAHLWAQTYDRDLADVFAIQSEIAKAIVDQLQAKLSPSEKSAIEAKPTSDITAFDLYSRGKTLLLQSVLSGRARNNLLQAVELLNQAVARDPTLMLGYCELEAAHTQLYVVHIDHTPQRLAAAEKAVQTALRLRPDAGEAHFAFAQYLYRCFLDYDRARAELAIAQRSLPHDAGIFALLAAIDRRQQRWDESIRNRNRAIELDPRNIFVFQQLALSHQMLRQYRECAATLDRALEVAPEDVDTRLQRAQVPLDAVADVGPLQAAIDSTHKQDPATASWLADGWFYLGLCKRDAAVIEQSVAALQGDSFRLMNTAFSRGSRAFARGWAARLRGDVAVAEGAFKTARSQQEELLRDQPDYSVGVCMLGLIDALLGQKEDALREGRRALELMPLSKDAITGSDVLALYAATCALADEKDLALQQLASAAKIPGTLSYGQLKLLPYWDPLRGDPRFEKIVASLAPKG